MTDTESEWCPKCGVTDGPCKTKSGRATRPHALRGHAVVRVTEAERIVTHTETVLQWACPGCGEISEEETHRVFYERHPATDPTCRVAWVPPCPRCNYQSWLVSPDLSLVRRGA